MAHPSSPSGPPAGANSRKSEPITKRSYTLRLTASSIMTAIIVLVIGIGWSFVLGVMVGRGYNPEKKIPQLASFLPKEDDTAQATTSRVGDDQPVDRIMRPEDLSYAASLKGKPGQGKLAVTPAKPAETKPKNMQNATIPVAQVHDATTGLAQPSLVSQPAVPEQAKAKAPAPAPTQSQFDFTFQVATFKETGSVDKLRAKLEGAGLRSRMEKTTGKTPLYKVLVLFRGTAEASQSVRQTLVDMGLGQPIQRGKSSVGSKK